MPQIYINIELNKKQEFWKLQKFLFLIHWLSSYCTKDDVTDALGPHRNPVLGLFRVPAGHILQSDPDQ